MKIICFIILCLGIAPVVTFSQQPEDTLRVLDEVVIKAFEQNSRRNSGFQVKVIETNLFDKKTSLVHEFNTVAGVRMEERSPGSYRLNIRGSSIRSPFGVRNVKVYWNELPVTDAGGNTYFNQFTPNNFSYLEIFKGPVSSMYGAGTGGLILMHSLNQKKKFTSLEYITGSFNLHNIFASTRFGDSTHRNEIAISHNQSDGYREQSSLRRDNFSWQSRIFSTGKRELNVAMLFTDMDYKTPGALTLAEYQANPRASRPAAGGFPSAVNARAAIYQQNLLAGFTNTIFFGKGWKNSTTLYGMYNQVKNPAIRNFERRKEPGFGGRTVFVFNKKNESQYSGDNPLAIQWVVGSEFSEGFYNIQVAKNLGGQPDSLQTNDDVRNSNQAFFTQADLSLQGKWFFTGGLGLNFSKVVFTRLSVYPVTEQKRTFRNEIAPRLNVQRKWDDRHVVGLTVSRGYSPPTVAELLPSNSVINTELEAEHGWNYEINAGTGLFRNRLRLNLNLFYFRLRDALVQRRDLSGADYFINAGDTKQKGLELESTYWLLGRKGIIDDIYFKISWTMNHFRYGRFIKGSDDFSGKVIPSVPSQTLSFMVLSRFDNGLYCHATYYYSSKIFLDDANRFSADPYRLLNIRAGWDHTGTKKKRLHFYAGVENLLDESYSLGNDINAPAGRFFNTAPRRNYYLGVALKFPGKF